MRELFYIFQLKTNNLCAFIHVCINECIHTCTHSCPLASTGVCFQDSPNPQMLKSYIKLCSICIQPTHILLYTLNHLQITHSAVCNSLRPWTVACQAPLSMGFSSKNTGVGCHVLLQGIFPTQRFCSHLLHLQADSLPSEPPGKPLDYLEYLIQCKCYVNSCKYDVNTMGIVARVSQIEVLLFGIFWDFFSS